MGTSLVTLCCMLHYLLGQVSVVEVDDGGEQLLAAGCHVPASAVGDLGQHAPRVQALEQPCDGAALASALFGAVGG